MNMRYKILNLNPVAILIVAMLFFTGIYAQQRSELRCGWFVNPTPSNAWLIDREREWIISIQGGYQAEGDWPDFKPSQWVETNGSYGYGCACMKVASNRSDEKIVNIISSYAKPLSACRRDKALKNKEPLD